MEKLSPATRFANENFPFSAHKLIEINGHIGRALRISFVGEMGNFSFSPF
jgi:glycine cleavage system aminomethyltransferase T